MSDFRRLPATTRAIGSRLISQEAPNKHRRCGRGPRVVALLATLSYLTCCCTLSLACATRSPRAHPGACGHLTMRCCDAMVAHQCQFFVRLAPPNLLLSGNGSRHKGCKGPC